MSDELERRRCLALRVAVIFGILLCLFNAAARFWPGVAVGAVGTVVALFMARRVCGQVRAKAPESRHIS
jgi:hypothetical protein